MGPICRLSMAAQSIWSALTLHILQNSSVYNIEYLFYGLQPALYKSHFEYFGFYDKMENSSSTDLQVLDLSRVAVFFMHHLLNEAPYNQVISISFTLSYNLSPYMMKCKSTSIVSISTRKLFHNHIKHSHISSHTLAVNVWIQVR